ncbi:uncharacterized protein LOC142240639 [Haematobia irritans]|uniref:uncharacterized protein LOC142240639 n=1 Tax=Haematobia irritans TaxID=7368 RepID=UPI003F4FB346
MAHKENAFNHFPYTKVVCNPFKKYFLVYFNRISMNCVCYIKAYNFIKLHQKVTTKASKITQIYIMKIFIGIVIFATFLLAVHSQCRNAPAQPRCRGPRNLGQARRGCRMATRWWYDTSSGSCKSFKYRGCGGNANRFCTKEACEERCERHWRH